MTDYITEVISPPRHFFRPALRDCSTFEVLARPIGLMCMDVRFIVGPLLAKNIPNK